MKRRSRTAMHRTMRAERSLRSRRAKRPGRSTRASGGKRAGGSVRAAPVTAAELRALRRELRRRIKPIRWNPEPDDVQRSVAQLVLTLVEFLRQLMERQAIRRMEQKTLTRREVEAVGQALMQLEETIRDIGARFGLSSEDLNLDLGPLGKLM